jgi:hypothetical protein
LAALIVKTAEAVLFASAALIVDDVSVPTDTVVTVKVAFDAPAATDTVADTVALAFDEVSEMVYPPVGAGDSSDTVPVELVPPETVDGLSVTLEIPSPAIASEAVAD